MAERQPLTSEQRKEIAKRRARKPRPRRWNQSSPPSTRTPHEQDRRHEAAEAEDGPVNTDLNPMEEILINREKRTSSCRRSS